MRVLLIISNQLQCSDVKCEKCHFGQRLWREPADTKSCKIQGESDIKTNDDVMSFFYFSEKSVWYVYGKVCPYREVLWIKPSC